MSTTDDTDDDIDSAEKVFDRAALEAGIAAAVRAFSKLLNHAADDWTSWEITISGLRDLRTIIFAETHTSDVLSYAFRQAMTEKLKLRKYAVLDQMDRPTRSACYKLMDSLEQISVWYAALPAADKLRWKHPQSIVKHAPRHLVQGGKGSNKPKNKGKKKRMVDAEHERLKKLLIQVIKELIEFKPEARKYLDLIDPPDEPNDSLDDI